MGFYWPDVGQCYTHVLARNEKVIGSIPIGGSTSFVGCNLRQVVMLAGVWWGHVFGGVADSVADRGVWCRHGVAVLAPGSPPVRESPGRGVRPGLGVGPIRC